MARSNNLYLFAWICAIILPLALQLIVTNVQDVRDYLGDYLGLPTLFFFFTSTYGFATVFVCYYQLGSLRRAGTLDLLRVSRLLPQDALIGVFTQLQVLLAPPVLGFILLLAVFSSLQARQGPQAGFVASLDLIAAIVLGMLLNQAILCALQLCGLFRSEALLAAGALLLSFVLNTAPVIVLFVMGAPWWAYLLTQLMLLALLLALALRNLRRLWPPSVLPRKGN